ncbi:hypothetical protein GJ496_006991 [Pomphorhynchus laevis]|nr:hypothetical protein GJ496_006991 [Pomphorhynchus laevis]
MARSVFLRCRSLRPRIPGFVSDTSVVSAPATTYATLFEMNFNQCGAQRNMPLGASTFLAFDEDKSGGIQKHEMQHVLQANGINANPQQVEDYVKRMDVNNDGQVSWTEYFKFMIDVFQGNAQGIMPR